MDGNTGRCEGATEKVEATKVVDGTLVENSLKRVTDPALPFSTFRDDVPHFCYHQSKIAHQKGVAMNVHFIAAPGATAPDESNLSDRFMAE